MRVWDSGTYECHKFREDEVIVTFHGNRLEGRYALFHAGKDPKDWMIHRMDPPADPGREPMPDRIVPMLARLGDPPRDEANHAFEGKWDGIRAILYSEPGRGPPGPGGPRPPIRAGAAPPPPPAPSGGGRA